MYIQMYNDRNEQECDKRSSDLKFNLLLLYLVMQGAEVDGADV